MRQSLSDKKAAVSATIPGTQHVDSEAAGPPLVILAYRRRSPYNLWALRTNGKRLWSLSADELGVNPLNGIFASLSPDLKEIAFVGPRLSNRNPSAYVYVMDIASKQKTPAGDKGDRLLCPRWSPQGNSILFVSIATEDFKQQVEIAGRPFTASTRNLTQRLALETRTTIGLVASSGWGHDGTYIYYARNCNQLLLLTPRGVVVGRVRLEYPPGTSCQSGVWDMSHDGKTLLVTGQVFSHTGPFHEVGILLRCPLKSGKCQVIPTPEISTYRGIWGSGDSEVIYSGIRLFDENGKPYELNADGYSTGPHVLHAVRPDGNGDREIARDVGLTGPF